MIPIVHHAQKSLKAPGLVAEGDGCGVRWPQFELGSATC